MTNKLIVLMIDGISADYFATCRGRLPHLSALAARGMLVQNLHSEVLGTSLPGRTSMITGATADVSGIYGNKIWDSTLREFRYATPYDVRVPTIPARLMAAGRESAVLGFGMVRPEDTTIFKPPWWIGTVIQRARDPEPVPAGDAWLKVLMMQDSGERFNKLCEAAGYPEGWPLIELNTTADRMVQGFMADQYAANWVGILAAAPDAPDFIIAEYLITDPIQHGTGYKSMLSHWAIAQADAAVGIIVERLRQAGVEDRWNIAVMSDHGHSPIRMAIRTPIVLPGVAVQSEGAVLLVAPKYPAELRRVTESLAEYGCEPIHTDYVPADHRAELAAFVAPPGITFETDPVTDDAPTGKPVNISSHGLRPGEPGDDRFAIFAGPDVTPGIIYEAAAVQVAPTFAKLLNMPLEGYVGTTIL